MAICMDEVASLLPADTPSEVSVQWIAETFGVTEATVKYAIQVGKLPARRIPDRTGGTAAWRVRPEHALLIWGHRLLTRNIHASNQG
ncbi:hypothetical protein [Mycobacteroides abscessus]|uniref:hypothetical protein n=1 Tax=Mycobacteroides abscessus TaxID=36809 RepID=UPI0007F97A57|nr:hypothetical protein [Mycobacteroides abscessus]ANO12767.1 hypothetical protein BAB77_01900 [Mycobacteroides abscessus]ARQ63019.1 hypothetical protein CAK77_02080 [Mycobacteroides abscessus subsp. massiliense]MBE5447568.1 hypothetical protein [Mycobacteroides abscessus]MBE5514189.1 hypothetical protein [Mycobacteroides abscessus]MBN7511810.1 hypothetical protein [Mycobacteroides abscessus subsp. massiliense]